MARRRQRRGADDDDFTYVHGGKVRRIEFEGSGNEGSQAFRDVPTTSETGEVEFRERSAPHRTESGEPGIQVRNYLPRHKAPIDDIQFEVDHLHEIRAGHIPRGVPPDRPDLIKPRDETLYETPRGRITSAEGPSGRVLYVERGSALRSERFRSSLVDVIVKDVDLEEEVVIRRKIIEEVPAETAPKPKKRAGKKIKKVIEGTAAKKTAAMKAPKTAVKSAKAKPARSQVSEGDYKLFHTGNRYFFSKKSQAESAKAGAQPVYEIPEDRKVVKTPNGLPVLKSRAAARKPAKKAAAKADATKPAAKAAVKKAAVKKVAATQAAKKAPAKKAATKPAAKKSASKAAKKAVIAKPVAAKKKSESQPQCAGLTADGKQCRNSARGVSKYCASHKGYRPRTIASTKALDTVPAAKQAKDTKPTKPSASKVGAPQAQCAGLTADGKQCRNSSRGGSKYCASHKGYRPAKGLAALDTKPRAKKAADTKPSIRKG